MSNSSLRSTTRHSHNDASPLPPAPLFRLRSLGIYTYMSPGQLTQYSRDLERSGSDIQIRASSRKSGALEAGETSLAGPAGAPQKPNATDIGVINGVCVVTLGSTALTEHYGTLRARSESPVCTSKTSSTSPPATVFASQLAFVSSFGSKSRASANQSAQPAFAIGEQMWLSYHVALSGLGLEFTAGFVPERLWFIWYRSVCRPCHQAVNV